MIVEFAVEAVKLFIDALKKAWKAFKRLRHEITRAIDACVSYRLSLEGFAEKYVGVRFVESFQKKIDIFKAKMDGSKKICDKLSAKSAVKRFLLAGLMYLPDLKHAVENIHEYWTRNLKEYIDNPRPMMVDPETEEEKAVKWAAMEKAKYEAELIKVRTKAEAEQLEAEKPVKAARLLEQKYAADARVAEAAKKAHQAAAEKAAEDARLEVERLKREADLAAVRKAVLDARNAELKVAKENEAMEHRMKQAVALRLVSKVRKLKEGVVAKVANLNQRHEAYVARIANLNQCQEKHIGIIRLCTPRDVLGLEAFLKFLDENMQLQCTDPMAWVQECDRFLRQNVLTRVLTDVRCVMKDVGMKDDWDAAVEIAR